MKKKHKNSAVKKKKRKNLAARKANEMKSEKGLIKAKSESKEPFQAEFDNVKKWNEIIQKYS